MKVEAIILSSDLKAMPLNKETVGRSEINALFEEIVAQIDELPDD
jgi:hypothetical protein